MNRPDPQSAVSAGRRGVDEHAVFLRSLSQVDWLALLICALYLLLSGAPVSRPGLALIAMGLFALVALGLRWRRVASGPAPLRIALDAAATIVFISVMASQSGGASSPLVNLYLLPIVMAAVTLGPGGTWTVFLAVCAAWLALVAGYGGLGGPVPALLARVLGQLGPFALVAHLTQRLASTILSARRQIEEFTERDALTGLVNRRSFEELLQRQHAGRQHGEGGYALLRVGIDELGQIVETAGREAGNAAIRNAAEAIKRTIRNTDLGARAGDDEFMVLLPGASPEAAAVVAQRIRNAVFKSLFQAGSRMQRMTVSVGAGAYPQDGRTADDAQATAEKRMHQDRNLRRKPGEPEPPQPSRL